MSMAVRGYAFKMVGGTKFYLARMVTIKPKDNQALKDVPQFTEEREAAQRMALPDAEELIAQFPELSFEQA